MCFWVKLLLGFSVKLPVCVCVSVSEWVWVCVCVCVCVCVRWESWVWICHLGLDLVQRTRSSSNASWSERSQGMTKIFTLFPKLSFINWSPGIYSVIFLFLLSHTHLHFLDIVYLVVKGRNMLSFSFFFFFPCISLLLVNVGILLYIVPCYRIFYFFIWLIVLD